MLRYLWNQYGFELLFSLSIIILIIIFIFNLFTKQKGTYNDYTTMIQDLWNKSYIKKKSKTPSFESKGEIECRRVIENITGKPFPKSRPDFLKNEITGGRNLELDCYNPELRLAIEYNGQQHYKYIPYFHQNKEAFYNIKYRDDMKNRLCKKYGIRLITVPYTVPISSIEKYLFDRTKWIKK